MRRRSGARTVVAAIVATSLGAGAAHAGAPGEPAWPPPGAQPPPPPSGEPAWPLPAGQTPPPPSPPIRVPPDDSRRHVYHYWNADKTFMLVGAATFAGSYGAPLAILVMFGARESGDSQDPDVDRRASADQRYFIPVVGPWLAYKKDPSQGDGMRDLAIVLGSAQLFGIGTFLIGATGNAQFFNVRRGHATLNVAPVTARDWAGLGLNGSF